MKLSHLSFIIGLGAAVITPMASADTIFGIYAGGGKWTSDYSGEAGDPAVTAEDLGLDESDNSFFYIAIEHPVPLLPNIKYTHQTIESEQTSVLEDDFGLGDADFPTGVPVRSDFDLSSDDYTFYYELLDNWVNMDLGVTARRYDGYFYAESLTEEEKVDLDITIPLLYAKFQFDLPLTGLSAALETNAVKYQDNRLVDYTAKIAYVFDSVLDLGLEAGYRKLSLKVDDDDTQADLDLDGPYVGAMIHF